MSTHIFIDNSNIFGGAQRAALTIEPGALRESIRIYYRNLFQFIEGNHNVETRVLAGSVPPGNDNLWNYARNSGYNTDLLKKVEKDDGRLGEQAVDEILHLKIANVLLDYKGSHNLILATGDGRTSKYGTSFAHQATRALKEGWNVEIWSWKDQLSQQFGLIPPYAGHININHLDPYYYQITFTQGGRYSIGGNQVNIVGRVVQNLV